MDSLNNILKPKFNELQGFLPILKNNRDDTNDVIFASEFLKMISSPYCAISAAMFM